MKTPLTENTFRTLRENGIVTSAENFSIDWCRRSQSYFAERKHTGNDFSIVTAMACLDKLRIASFFLRERKKRFQANVDEELNILLALETQLLQFLDEHHDVTHVTLRRSAQMEYLNDIRREQ